MTAVLPNDGRPGNSRMRTDGILSSRPVPGSWQSPRRALRGPRTAENTGRDLSSPLLILFFHHGTVSYLKVPAPQHTFLSLSYFSGPSFVEFRVMPLEHLGVQ